MDSEFNLSVIDQKSRCNRRPYILKTEIFYWFCKWSAYGDRVVYKFGVDGIYQGVLCCLFQSNNGLFSSLRHFTALFTLNDKPSPGRLNAATSIMLFLTMGLGKPLTMSYQNARCATGYSSAMYLCGKTAAYCTCGARRRHHQSRREGPSEFQANRHIPPTILARRFPQCRQGLDLGY